MTRLQLSQTELSASLVFFGFCAPVHSCCNLDASLFCSKKQPIEAPWLVVFKRLIGRPFTIPSRHPLLSVGLVKTSRSTPPLRFGQNAEYEVSLTNTGTAVAYDVANIVDTLPPGQGTASLISATLNGSNVAGAPGFSFTQSGQQVTVTVRNLSGQATLAVGATYVVRYSVPLTAAVNGSTGSLVNTASVAAYSTGTLEGGPRETLTNITPASATVSVDSNNISGRVIFSRETAGSGQQNGVSGATVALVGTSFTSSVDANGVFSMSGVPDGTYTVRAT